MQTGISKNFGKLGGFIGTYPFVCLILSIVIFLPGLFGVIFKFKLDPALGEKFTKPDSAGRREIAYQKEFFGRRLDEEPYYLALFGRVKNESGNMLNEAEFDELNNFQEHFTNANLHYNGTVFTWKDLCKPFCDINAMLTKAMPLIGFASKGYPNFNVDIPFFLSAKMNLGKNLFQREMDEKTGELKAVKLMAFYYTTFLDSEEKSKQVEVFENNIVELARIHNANNSNRVEIIPHGTYMVKKEIVDGSKTAMQYIAGGLLILAPLAFVLILIFMNLIYKQMSAGMLSLTVVGIFPPILALINAVGLICLVGFEANLLFMTSPLVAFIFAINYDGIFQIVGTWNRISENALKRQATRKERMSEVFEKVGAPYITATVSLILAFSISAFFVVFNYKIYFVAIALAVFFNQIFQLFFFCSILSLTCGCVEIMEKGYEPPNQPQQSSYGKKFRKCVSKNIIGPYAKFLQSDKARLLAVFILFIVYLWPVTVNIRKIPNRMDYKKFLPNGTKLNRGFDLVENHLWNDYLQEVFIINKPPDFTNENEYKNFRKLISEIEAINGTVGKESNMMWLYDYYTSALGHTYDEYNETGAINMSKFPEFIEGFPYSAWKSGVNYKINNETTPPQTTIQSMVFMVAFKGTNSLAAKFKTINTCRDVVKKFPQFDVAVFDTDSGTVDIMAAVPCTIFAFLLTLGISTTLVVLFIGWNFVATLVTAGFSATFIAGLLGIGYYLGLEYDVILASTICISAAFGLYLIVQVVIEFMCFYDELQRLPLTIERSGSHIVKTILLVLLMTVPVFFAPVELYSVASIILALAGALTLLHAFFFIPTTLGGFPDTFVGSTFCYDSD